MIFTAFLVDNLGRNELGVAAINSDHVATFMPGRMKDDSPEWTELTLSDGQKVGVKVPFSGLVQVLGASTVFTP